MNQYICWVEELGIYEDDHQTVEADNKEEAAIKFVAEHERLWVDYSIALGNRTIGINVREPDKQTHKLTVCGEIIPHYYIEKRT